MTASAAAPSQVFRSWNSIPWKTVVEAVQRLQMRIAKAVREGNQRRVKALQWLLTHSYYAKLLAVKRVVENRGKKTPGVDGVIWNTSDQKIVAVNELRRGAYKSLPLRRIYIPKKNGRKRPLSIPTMKDRAMQALHLFTLKPIAETTADPNSYGFREGRCCQDALEQCHNALSHRTSAKWILEGDIKACFDGISHEWLRAHIPMDRKILSAWLCAGYVEGKMLYPTEAGTPQGGIASPCLANIALDGLEAAIRKAVPYRSCVNVVRYADDFIVTGRTKELLEQTVKPVIESFLSARGLALSQEKTKITQIEDGFSFLGQHVRKYKQKLLIKPSKEGTRAFLKKVKSAIKACRGLTAEALIRKLNPIIRGWCFYHRASAAKKTFSHVTKHLLDYLWSWIRRTHPNKSRGWMKKKYFMATSRRWVFSCRTSKKHILELCSPSRVPILRHAKVIAAANPYDPLYVEYFLKRKQKAWRLAKRT